VLKWFKNSTKMKDNKIRVLWVTLRVFSAEAETQTAAWLKAQALLLKDSGFVTLCNISTDGRVNNVERRDFDSIEQWVFPSLKLDGNGMPPLNICNEYKRVIDEFKPDIIQVWGSENPLGMCPFKVEVKIPVVFIVQGVLFSIADCLLKDLSFKERLSCIGLREIITRSSVFSSQKSFVKDGIIEKQMINHADYIVVQSKWTESQILSVKRDAKVLFTHRCLRKEFLELEKWTKFQHDRPIIYSAAIGYPLKGTLTLLKTLCIVKNRYPDVELRIAGRIGRTDWLGDGYLRMLMRFIDKNGLSNNVVFLGAINASQIIKELQSASVFVNPSFVESYSQVVAEAMAVGTPSVVSYAGAMPELAPNDEVLFFTPGDYRNCAHKICELLSNSTLANELSEKAYHKSNEREKEFDIVQEQINIYNTVLNEKK